MELDPDEVAPDLRSDRMPSAEGQGLARTAWEKYVSGVRKVVEPAVTPLARRWGASAIADLVGFWALWHLHGGFEGLQQLGMGRTTIFRKVKRFRQVFGAHPDELAQLPGIRLDVAGYWKNAERDEAERQRRVAAMKQTEGD